MGNAASQSNLQSNYLRDVTVFEDRVYTEKELEKYEEFLRAKLEYIAGLIDKLGDNKDAGFIKEYGNITDGQRNECTISMKEEHKHLNRYVNIVAFDKNRVKIQEPSEHTFKTDYINGSHVNGATNSNKYIATQGPVPDSMAGFWQMVWEQNASLIVMVTSEIEGGKLKCHRYWPDQYERTASYGLITVSHQLTEVRATFIIRHFEITHPKSKTPRQITQFAYTGWPDHGCPETTADLLQFRAAVREHHYKTKGPIVVHCSAGVGRTGTYIGLDRFLDECDSKSNTSVLEIVKDMRQSRNFMVQSQVQYVYLYEACRDGLAALLSVCRHQRQFLKMSKEQKEDFLLSEIEGDLEDANRQLDERMAEGNGYDDEDLDEYDERRMEVIHARASVGKHTDDMDLPKMIPLESRTSSLLHYAADETEYWKMRDNVPLEVDEKGYALPKVASIDQRLSALANKKRAWQKKKYDEAAKLWQGIQTRGDNSYDIGASIAPLAIRVQGLANAEEMWRSRGDGFRSVTLKRKDPRAAISALTNRLGSLAYLVTHGDPRWRTRGDGFAKGNVPPADLPKQHSVEKFGSLENRLSLLQKHEMQWEDRSLLTKYDPVAFKMEVARDKAEQGQRETAEREAREKAVADVTQAAEDDKTKMKVAAAKAQEEEAEARRKEGIRATAQASSVVEAGYDPTAIRNSKQKDKDDKDKALRDVAAKKQAEKDAKAKKEQDKLEEKAAAKAKAEKFMKKLK